MSYNAIINPVLEKWVQDDQIPMIVGGFVTKEGIQYLHAEGVNDVSNRADKTTTETVFDLYSLSKAVTSTAMVQLLDAGVVGLDDLVETHLLEVKDFQVIEGFEEDGTPILREAVNKPTIRNLLTHTAGLAYPFFSEKELHMYRYIRKNKIKRPLGGDIPTAYIHEPGTKWHYGTSIDVLGKVIESVTHKRLEEYLVEHIFKPLGMTHTTFIKTPRILDNKAKLHRRNREDGYKVIPDLKPLTPELFSGGGGLCGTVGDYLKFLQMFLNDGCAEDGTSVISTEAMHKYSFANLVPPDISMATTLELVQPQVALLMAFLDELPINKQSWTASFYRLDLPLPTGRKEGSLMWFGLANLFYWIDTKSGVAGVFATLVFPFFDITCLTAYQEFEAAVYKAIGTFRSKM